MLQHNATWFHTGVDVCNHFPGGYVDHGYLIYCRHRDVEPFVVAAEHPVFTRTLQQDQRVEFAAAKAAQRIDDRYVWLVVQCEDEVGVEIDCRTLGKRRL